MPRGRVSLLLHPIQYFRERKLTKLVKSATGTTYVGPPKSPEETISSLLVTTDGVVENDINPKKEQKKKEEPVSQLSFVTLAGGTSFCILASLFLFNDMRERIENLEAAPNMMRRELIPSYQFQGSEPDALKSNKLKEKDDTFNNMISNPDNPLSALSKALTALSDYAKPRVVRIENFGSTGSGFVYSEDGLIITNYHVVDLEEPLSPLQMFDDRIKVTFYDGSTKSGSIIEFDPIRDIAVIKVNATNLPTLKLAKEEPKSGEPAMTVGSPLDLGWSTALGIVSNSKRQLEPKEGLFPSFLPKRNVIQLDLPVIPGNSGGPVLNMQGEVIGIAESSSWVAGLENTSFCVPADSIQRVISRLNK